MQHTPIWTTTDGNRRQRTAVAPCCTKYTLRNSWLSARHLCFVQTIFRSPKCSRSIIGEPQPGFEQLMDLYMSSSCGHRGCYYVQCGDVNVPHTHSHQAMAGAYAPLGVHTTMRCADVNTICMPMVMRAVPLHKHIDLLVAHVADHRMVQLAAVGYGT